MSPHRSLFYNLAAAEGAPIPAWSYRLAWLRRRIPRKTKKALRAMRRLRGTRERARVHRYVAKHRAAWRASTQGREA